LLVHEEKYSLSPPVIFRGACGYLPVPVKGNPQVLKLSLHSGYVTRNRGKELKAGERKSVLSAEKICL